MGRLACKGYHPMSDNREQDDLISQDTSATDKGRQGVVSSRIVTILGVSTALAVVALFVVYAIS